MPDERIRPYDAELLRSLEQNEEECVAAAREGEDDLRTALRRLAHCKCFGVGPHLLTARDGTQALCGGPGGCLACAAASSPRTPPKCSYPSDEWDLAECPVHGWTGSKI